MTLLPRHWDSLQGQPGGASVALRKLVDEARHARQWADRARASSEAVPRFMFALAGNLTDFEEASRSFYAKNSARLRALVKSWPRDVRDHLLRLAETAFRDTKTAREHEAEGRPSRSGNEASRGPDDRPGGAGHRYLSGAGE